jgi:glycosyltransferase involved in cell wall biosynthesis
MHSIPHQTPEKIEHFLPEGASPDPVELSLVVPAMNEKITVGEFVDWCHEGLRKAGVTGQILIVDSSSDDTPNIVLAHGGEVLRTPKRGLGRAYIDAIPYIRGKWIIMGDADLTYDFRELIPFVEEFKKGSEFVMGSRFRGSIEDGAMPPLHRYFGTPLTTWILNVIYGSHYSDIHCGMRGVTKEAFLRMRLRSQSWQYASEMIIKSKHLNLKISEVPIHFYKDRDGRVSNLKRIGWWSPFHAGWISLQAMLTHGADFFLFKPGIILLLISVCAGLLLFNGPRLVFGIGYSLHWLLFFCMLGIVGFQSLLMGILAKTIYDIEWQFSAKWQRLFSYNRTVLFTSLLYAMGGLFSSGLVFEYIKHGFKLPPQLGVESYRAVIGLTLFIIGTLYFTFGLIFNALRETVKESQSR